jgi:hypothetical protein
VRKLPSFLVEETLVMLNYVPLGVIRHVDQGLGMEWSETKRTKCVSQPFRGFLETCTTPKRGAATGSAV